MEMGKTPCKMMYFCLRTPITRSTCMRTSTSSLFQSTWTFYSCFFPQVNGEIFTSARAMCAQSLHVNPLVTSPGSRFSTVLHVVNYHNSIAARRSSSDCKWNSNFIIRVYSSSFHENYNDTSIHSTALILGYDRWTCLFFILMCQETVAGEVIGGVLIKKVKSDFN